jgi:quercetin dioxygenase-like cupin family protein
VGNSKYGLDATGQLVHQVAQRMHAEEGATVICRLRGEAHDQGPILYEVSLAPHCKAAPPFTHPLRARTLYVLEGTLAIRLGDQTFTVDAADVVQVGPAVPCSAWNPTSAVVRYLAIITPAHRNQAGNDVKPPNASRALPG